MATNDGTRDEGRFIIDPKMLSKIQIVDDEGRVRIVPDGVLYLSSDSALYLSSDKDGPAIFKPIVPETTGVGGGGVAPSKPESPATEKADGSSEAKAPEATEITAGSTASTVDVIAALAAARRTTTAVDAQIDALGDAGLRERYVSALIAEQEDLDASIAWAASSDAQLLGAVGESRRGGIAEELLRAKYGVRREDAALASKRVEFEEQRVRLFEQLVEYSKEFIKQRRAWRSLSKWAPWLLLLMLLASIGLSIAVISLVGAGRIDGWQGGLLIFVLALMAVSPATLLLIERPLQGIDSWKPTELKAPSTGAGGESDSDGADADTAGEDAEGDAGKPAGAPG
ncbi:hypothetical protein [Agromyces mangrovi Wang et al. 2018]|uniref:hypothetical protein n=1 Tax=Agromyces mangrovi TaxID=1858653 RepID=UPI0025731682|nr:hypothetical protein [Agromyces mangrovi]BDZ65466.1 hypothetical protein GCM10025877_24040 [Agromyces mangrovi]